MIFMFTLGLVGFCVGGIYGSMNKTINDSMIFVHCFGTGIIGSAIFGSLGLAIDAFLFGLYIAKK